MGALSVLLGHSIHCTSALYLVFFKSYTVVPLLRDPPDQRPPHISDHYARGHMLRFALFPPPDEGPPLFKDHLCVNHRVVSQEGDYCTWLRAVTSLKTSTRLSFARACNCTVDVA